MKIEIRTTDDMNKNMIDTAAKAKAAFASLEDEESIIFEFSGDFDPSRKIFKKTGGRLIVGDAVQGVKAEWSEGFGPEDWK